MKKCYECNSNQIINGYSETIVTSIKYQIKYFCQECLTDYSKKRGAYNTKHVRKLRDTNIEKYLEVVNDFDFIPYADKYKTASYYYSESHNLAETKI